jgi:hypothetical protein
MSFDGAARLRILALEEWTQRRDRDIADLHFFLSRESRLRAVLADTVSRLTAQIAELRSIQETKHKGPYAAEIPRAQAPLPQSPRTWPKRLPSLIISDFPDIFIQFQEKRFSLLWRGSRDGFGARDFHGRCDGHRNTLTVILDTHGNVFGGFTPVAWESRVWDGKRGTESNCWKTDDSLQSFLFTLKNPFNVPPRRFVLKTEEKLAAINCHSGWGPRFCDISIYDHCNVDDPSSFRSTTHFFGTTYVNDTGLGGVPPHSTFFTGSEFFEVKEIEVFEITD